MSHFPIKNSPYKSGYFDLRRVVDDVRTCFARPKLYAKEGFKTANTIIIYTKFIVKPYENQLKTTLRNRGYFSIL